MKLFLIDEINTFAPYQVFEGESANSLIFFSDAGLEYVVSFIKDETLDDCENVTRSLNDFLDELIPVKYYLEVSSPGLERKFKSDKEFIIFKGRRISLKLKTPLEGETERIFKGEIIDWDDNEGLTFLRFEDGEELQIPKDNIQSAKLYID